MIPRDKLVSILAQMDTPSLLRALAVNGIHVGQPQGDDVLEGMEADDGIQSWNDRKIQVGEDDRPALSDKPFLEQKPVQPTKPPYLVDGYDASLDPYNFPQDGT